MSAPSKSGSRALRPALIAAGALAIGAAAVGFVWTSRAADAERARAAAGAELDALMRCLAGAPLPLQEGETLAGRMRGIELAIALTRADLEAEEEAKSGADAGAGTDAGADAGAGADTQKPVGDPWPARCAPLADKLARTLDSAALSGDKYKYKDLDALREALPTRARLEMPYALRADEADDLIAAIAKANLPAPSSPPDAEVPSAPSPLAAPLATGDLKPLAQGKLPLSRDVSDVSSATDPLATRALRLLLNDTRTTRLCALAPDDPKGPYATAKCGDLPAEWKTNVRLTQLADAAPTALFVKIKTGIGSGGQSDPTAEGVVIFAPGGQKALPMSLGSGGASAYIANDGAYMLTSGNYASFVRIGTLDKLKTTDVTQAPSDPETARALPPDNYQAFPAYGYVFWAEPPSYYAFGNPPRDFWYRRVLPTLAPAETSAGTVPSSYPKLRGGCQGGGRTAVLFGDDERYRVTRRETAHILVAEGDGEPKAFDADIGATLPHITCAPDAVVVTSVKEGEARGHYVVLESRCTAAGCATRASDPIAALAGTEVDAATLDGGAVVFVWKMRADQATSAARNMAFYHLAPLDKLAATPPRPLLENKRHGGIDVDHIHLIHRGPAAILAMESGGKTPITHAVRIEAGGGASPVHVEETKW
jgi:hypothetical protein